jgi:hypothetical protein
MRQDTLTRKSVDQGEAPAVRTSLPPAAALARDMHPKFKAAVAEAIRTTLSADRPVPVVDDTGKLVWLHADGRVSDTDA